MAAPINLPGAGEIYGGVREDNPDRFRIGVMRDEMLKLAKDREDVSELELRKYRIFDARADPRTFINLIIHARTPGGAIVTYSEYLWENNILEGSTLTEHERRYADYIRTRVHTSDIREYFKNILSEDALIPFKLYAYDEIDITSPKSLIQKSAAKR